ncbi:flagellar hook protein (plasmid) [Azospirillum argentinense]|uniref:Flagellar hook protein FlgE n=3 Tax=Azospirillum TaxID=191 RepID=A0A2K1FTS7_9PROT|nr:MULTISPECIES: flagellar hook protein FlgE [Azospirillum]AIB16223.1 flagellar hook protein [Azospirillum argentinense]EZQ02625.1 flagellar hook protein [Azospirillum argentinense]KAA1056854.1 Flagellar hook protein FlgE [Azospirillum argentinense]MBY3756947.1 flagellar hook protein FlgE [Azospirillum formosense]NUB19638.1 flagellar hook-basal body complex protein [Azospirillum formosense]
MSLFSAMRSGVSGMSAQSSRMAAISDNISNSATIGYKRAAVDFSTLMTSSGSTSNYSAGGVRSNVHYQVLKDGTIQGTQSATDMAIEGRGFFVVADNAGTTGTSPGYALTRAGSFLPDDQGFLRNSAGQYLQAWKLGPDGSLPAVNRSSFDGLSAVSIAGLAYGGSKTTQMSFAGNLPAQATDGTSFDTSTSLYDGLGNPLDVTMTWTKTANPNEWTLSVTPPAGYTATLSTNTVTFNTTGANAGLPAGALPQITLTSPANPTPDTVNVTVGNLTQLNGDYVPQFMGDGARAGRVSTVDIDKAGTLWAVYDNGARQPLYQVPVADVVNPGGLVPQDGNTYTLGIDSGTMTLSNGNSGTAGSVAGYALEQSNVDIAEELVSLIETQRAYSSNATLVRTADEMVDETTRLKR